MPIISPSVIEDSIKAKALITQWIKTNKWLRKIAEECKLDCDVTTYVARHTWATTAKRLGYSIELIAEALVMNTVIGLQISTWIASTKG